MNLSAVEVGHTLLPYEKEIFTQLLDADGLLIMGKHLGIHRIVRQFVKLFSQPTSIVIILNTSHEERTMYIDDLAIDADTKHLPKIITNECDSQRRSEIYPTGGVMFVTSRILVVDMLSGIVPIEHLSGIMVCNAHRVTEKSSEAFILRLYREKNKTGFIKAYTDSPEGVASGLAQVTRLMKNLFVTQLFIWPRFHSSVHESLTKYTADVVELDVELTEDMQTIQTSILAIHNMCLQEIKRGLPGVELDDLNLENGLFSAFNNILRRRLEPVAHRMSAKTKQLQTDLVVITRLLSYLTEYDCVSFHNYLETLRTSSSTFNQTSSWMFQDVANMLFETAKRRVYYIETAAERAIKKARKQNSTKDSNIYQADENTATQPKELTVKLEENPKWAELAAVLKEIETETVINGENPGTTLVLVSEERTAWQLRDYLSIGGRQLLERGFRKHMALRASWKAVRMKFTAERAIQKAKTVPGAPGSSSNQVYNTHRRGRRRYREEFQSNDLEELVQNARANALAKANVALKNRSDEVYGLSLVPADENRDLPAGDMSDPEDESNIVEGDVYLETFYGVLDSPVVVIRSMRVSDGSWHLEKILADANPRYIIMYDPDPAAIRQVEVFRSLRTGMSLRVYFLWYKESVEAQRYLTTIRQEKEAFEKLIYEKSRMAYSHEQDGKSLNFKQDDQMMGSSTRKAMRNKVQATVVVDVREFRSALPSMLHAASIHVIPVTIEVGDYIITPDMCMERKSLSDLIGSLKSGRLYNQCQAMQRHYKIPILLIEFSDTATFSLHSKNDFSGDISWDHMTSKLSLLTLHFPTLRLVWAKSPHMSAEVIQSLKIGHGQPDATTCMSKRATNEDQMISTGYYNQTAKQLLLKLPGITAINCKHVMDNITSVYELSQLPLSGMQALIGLEPGKMLHEFINQSL
eukprot:CFRG2151T1